MYYSAEMKNSRRLIGLLLLSCVAAWAEDAPKQFFLVLLKRPPNAPPISQEAAEELQARHIGNIHKMYDEGKLVIAGPFMDDTSLRGIFVLPAASAREAQDWADQDPAVKAGRLKAEVHGPWQIRAEDIHKSSETQMELYSFVFLKRPTRSGPAEIGGNLTNKEVALGGAIGDGGDIAAAFILTGPPDQARQEIMSHKSYKLDLEIHPWITTKGVLSPGQLFDLK